MSMELLKTFAIEAKQTEFSNRESLEVSNPLYVNDAEVDSRAILYISKDGGDYEYIISFFDVGVPPKILYYFCTETTTIYLTFFHPKW